MYFQKSWIKLPEYLKSHTPTELYDLKKSPFAYAAGKEGLTYYEVLNEDEAQRNIWNNTMMQMEKNMPILGMFPFSTLKEQFERSPELPFIVDIGSGKGQAMLAIETECPKFFGGKVILQDLPIVINSLKAEDIPGITPTIHDIFTPQPVKSTCSLPHRCKTDSTRCPCLLHASPASRFLYSRLHRHPEKCCACNGSRFTSDYL
jgi:hypothetical protein